MTHGATNPGKGPEKLSYLYQDTEMAGGKVRTGGPRSVTPALCVASHAPPQACC